MQKELSAGCVVVHDGKYLVLHYEAGHWDLPKGHIEKGESERAAALRELEEETGISGAKIIEGFQESIHYFFKRKGELVSKDVVFFLCKCQTRKVTLSDEHTGFEWLSYDAALNKLTYDTAKKVLREAYRFENE